MGVILYRWFNVQADNAARLLDFWLLVSAAVGLMSNFTVPPPHGNHKRSNIGGIFAEGKA
jgi:hypothetical protein